MELKHPEYFHDLGFDMEDMLFDQMESLGLMGLLDMFLDNFIVIVCMYM